MFINIRELDRDGVRLDDEIAIPPFEWEGGQTVRCTPARVTGTLRPTSRGLELKARVETEATLSCFRCLEPFRHEVRTTFRLFVVALEDGEREEPEGEDDRDAVDLYPLEGDRLDVGEVLREQIDLALPFRALCRPGCRGYCPGCGAALNEEPCRCTGEDETDDARGRLRAIREILERRKGRSGGD